MNNTVELLGWYGGDKEHAMSKRKNSWTSEEDAFLIEHYATSSKGLILEGLPNRSWDAIMTRAKVTHKLTRTVKNNVGNTYRKGKSPWNKGKSWDAMKGANNPRYKGNQYISNRGYRCINIAEDTTEGWVSYRPEHLYIMEQHIGRPLNRSKTGVGEGVHHIDGNKLNNSLDNLLLYSSESEHRSIHSQLEALAFELVQKGIIKFDNEKRQYYAELS